MIWRSTVFCSVLMMLAFSTAMANVVAQPDNWLDDLPNCQFSATAPNDNIIVGAVVYNLRTQRGCTENLDEVFHVASVPKLMVAGAFYDAMLREGIVSFDTAMTFSERYWMGGRGDCLDVSRLNQQVTLGELSEMMIYCSDNAATWMLMDAIGWETVNQYIAGLGIAGIGEVIPYAEVDRQKLILLDDRWQNVPTAMASRFYRSDVLPGLANYFTGEAPTTPYTPEQELDASARYFDQTDYNTLTPRAMAEYLRQMALAVQYDTDEGQAAWWLFNTMLLTQRQYSTQAMPGRVLVGAKNGFDYGLRAEVNVIFEPTFEDDRNPTAFVILFTRQPDFTQPDIQPPTNSEANGVLNRYLLQLSPVVRDLLYPNAELPPVEYSNQIRTALVNPKLIMDSCWNAHAQTGYQLIYDLEACWLSQSRSRFVPGDFIGVGLLLQRLGERDARLTYVFTDPNGIARSYHTEYFLQNDIAVYWFHPIPDDPASLGEWRVDVYLNRVRVYSELITVEPLF